MTNTSTELREYEREKFELAAVFRSVEALPARTSHTNDKQVRELFCPLAEEDLRILHVAISTARRVFVVVNKQDTVSSEEREEALGYVHRQLSQVLGAMQLLERIRSLTARVTVSHPTTTMRENEPMVSYDTYRALQQLRPCEICTHIADVSFKFLSHYQYDLSINPEVQRSHAEQGGLCGMHTC